MKAGPEMLWQLAVMELAQLGGWRIYHPPDNRPIKTVNGRVRKQTVAKGFPDLTLLRGSEHMVVELKAEKGRMSPEQTEWLEAFTAAGVETHVWRPSNLEHVKERLLRRAPQEESLPGIAA